MKTACVILAAGLGQRMGGRNKALLSWAGLSFLETIRVNARSVGTEEFVVVVGEPHAAETQAAALDLGLTCTVNPHPEKGMASSVAVGFAFALRNFNSDTCWLWPVDSPGIEPSTLSKLAGSGSRQSIITPRYAGRGGHPSLVGRDIWPQLANCESQPEGARSVFRRRTNRRHFIDVEDPAACHDVDRPEDLEMLPC